MSPLGNVHVVCNTTNAFWQHRQAGSAPACNERKAPSICSVSAKQPAKEDNNKLSCFCVQKSMVKITHHISLVCRVLPLPLCAEKVIVFVIIGFGSNWAFSLLFVATAAPPPPTHRGSSMRSLSAAAAPSRSCVVVAAFQSRPVGVCCSHRVVVARPTPSNSPLLHSQG